MKKVTVSANKDGLVVVPNANKPTFGYVRVSQVRTVVDEEGFAKSSEVSALIHGPLEDLNKAGYTKGEELEGKITIREQLTPFNKEDAEKAKKDLKRAGDEGIICTVGKLPIYRKAFYDQTGTKEDILLKHTNSAEIKAAKAKLEKANLSR